MALRSARLRRILLTTTCLAAAGPAFAGPAPLLPTGGQVVQGGATIATPSSTSMVITQSTQTAVINWNDFSIAGGNSVRFDQPNASAIAFNRVTGPFRSDINGTLTANGHVWISNPNGILLGRGAVVDVGGLVATTSGMSDANFMAGRYLFDQPGNAGATVVNQGSIKAAPGSSVILSGERVSNEGIIQAELGAVVLGGAKTFALDLYGDKLVRFAVTAPSDATDGPLVDNSGTISANGGRVLLTARAAKSIVDNVINTSGIIEAKTASLVNGEIVFDGGDVGTVQVAGTVDASGKSAGETGGTVKALGEKIALTDTARIDASGDSGGGTVLVGGNFHGAGPERNAAMTFVASGAVITADALASGDGGKVAIWADGRTLFGGRITARGGRTGGDGGFVETSGKATLTVANTARVDTSAPRGKLGRWLLDPHNITVQSGGPESLSQADAFATTPSADATIDPSLINNASSTVVLQANSDLNINDPIAMTNAGAGLTLQAGRIVVVKQSISTTNGVLTIVADDPGAVAANIDAGPRQIAVFSSVVLSTGSGAISLTAPQIVVSPSDGFVTAGAAITVSGALLLNGTSSTTNTSVTFDTTKGGIAPGGAPVAFNGTIDAQFPRRNGMIVTAGTTGDVTFTQRVGVNNVGSGASGDPNGTRLGAVSLTGRDVLFNIAPGANGDGFSAYGIVINARNVAGTSYLSSKGENDSTVGLQDGAAVAITASGSLSLTTAGTDLAIDTRGGNATLAASLAGNGAGITIAASSVSLPGGINARGGDASGTTTANGGDGASITVNSTGSLSIGTDTNRQLVARGGDSIAGNGGNAGSIALTGAALDLPGGVIARGGNVTGGSGQGGNGGAMTLTATAGDVHAGSGAGTAIFAGAGTSFNGAALNGSGGSIQIAADAGAIVASNGISSSGGSGALGGGGAITLHALNDIAAGTAFTTGSANPFSVSANGSDSKAISLASGDAGSIDITSTGGNIFMPFGVFARGGDSIVNPGNRGGNGGPIHLTASNGSVIVGAIDTGPKLAAIASRGGRSLSGQGGDAASITVSAQRVVTSGIFAQGGDTTSATSGFAGHGGAITVAASATTGDAVTIFGETDAPNGIGHASVAARGGVINVASDFVTFTNAAIDGVGGSILIGGTSGSFLAGSSVVRLKTSTGTGFDGGTMVRLLNGGGTAGSGGTIDVKGPIEATTTGLENFRIDAQNGSSVVGGAIGVQVAPGSVVIRGDSASYLFQGPVTAATQLLDLRTTGGPAATFQGAVTAPALVSSAGSPATLQFNGGATFSGTSVLSGTVLGGGAITIGGATLVGTTKIDTSGANAAITLGPIDGATAGAQPLDVLAGTGALTLNNGLGVAIPLGDVSLSAGTIHLGPVASIRAGTFSTPGSITLRGTIDQGAASDVIITAGIGSTFALLAGSTITLGSNFNTLRITADDVNLASGASSIHAAHVVLQPVQNSTKIGIGSGPALATATFKLSQSELDTFAQISSDGTIASTLVIGRPPDVNGLGGTQLITFDGAVALRGQTGFVAGAGGSISLASGASITVQSVTVTPPSGPAFPQGGLDLATGAGGSIAQQAGSVLDLGNTVATFANRLTLFTDTLQVNGTVQNAGAVGISTGLRSSGTPTTIALGSGTANLVLDQATLDSLHAGVLEIGNTFAPSIFTTPNPISAITINGALNLAQPTQFLSDSLVFGSTANVTTSTASTGFIGYSGTIGAGSFVQNAGALIDFGAAKVEIEANSIVLNGAAGTLHGTGPITIRPTAGDVGVGIGSGDLQIDAPTFGKLQSFGALLIDAAFGTTATPTFMNIDGALTTSITTVFGDPGNPNLQIGIGPSAVITSTAGPGAALAFLTGAPGAGAPSVSATFVQHAGATINGGNADVLIGANQMTFSGANTITSNAGVQLIGATFFDPSVTALTSSPITLGTASIAVPQLHLTQADLDKFSSSATLKLGADVLPPGVLAQFGTIVGPASFTIGGAIQFHSNAVLAARATSSVALLGGTAIDTGGHDVTFAPGIALLGAGSSINALPTGIVTTGRVSGGFSFTLTDADHARLPDLPTPPPPAPLPPNIVAPPPPPAPQAPAGEPKSSTGAPMLVVAPPPAAAAGPAIEANAPGSFVPASAGFEAMADPGGAGSTAAAPLAGGSSALGGGSGELAGASPTLRADASGAEPSAAPNPPAGGPAGPAPQGQSGGRGGTADGAKGDQGGGHPAPQKEAKPLTSTTPVIAGLVSELHPIVLRNPNGVAGISVPFSSEGNIGRW